jgi:hypothetical protein
MTGVMIDPVTGEIIDQKELAERLLAQAKEQGVSLVLAAVPGNSASVLPNGRIGVLHPLHIGRFPVREAGASCCTAGTRTRVRVFPALIP